MEPIVNYSVYMHITPSGKKYVGITRLEPEKRWQGGSGYRHNEYFTKAIKKYGWQNITHIVLETGLTAEQAEREERRLIVENRSNDRRYGYNLTDGGETGKQLSDESRKRISEKKIGKPSSRKGKHHTAESKRKMSLSSMGRIMTVEQMTPAWNARRKRVAQLSKSGELIAIYESTVAAGKAVGGNESNIVGCAKGKRGTAFGYRWEYVEGL